jgi:hypothetical protein
MLPNDRIAIPPPVVNVAEEEERLLLVVTDRATWRVLEEVPLFSWEEGVREALYLDARFPHLCFIVQSRERGPP